jgi:hypothetical protein
MKTVAECLPTYTAMPAYIATLLERAFTEIIAQGERGYDPYMDSSLLRTENGLACIIGCLLEDKFYKTVLEDNVNLTARDGEPLRVALAKSHPDLPLSPFHKQGLEWQVLCQLQMAHDTAANLDEFLENTPEIIKTVLENSDF